MNRVPDREKMRQEYLQKKGEAERLQTYGCMFFGLAVLCSIGFGVGALGSLFTKPENGGGISGFFGSAFFSIVCAGVAWGLWTVVQTGIDDSRIPEVAPVSADSLPSDEILVRGSVEPDAPSETLLRATVKGEETKAEELLRNSQTRRNPS